MCTNTVNYYNCIVFDGLSIPDPIKSSFFSKLDKPDEYEGYLVLIALSIIKGVGELVPCCLLLILALHTIIFAKSLTNEVFRCLGFGRLNFLYTLSRIITAPFRTIFIKHSMIERNSKYLSNTRGVIHMSPCTPQPSILGCKPVGMWVTARRLHPLYWRSA